MNTQQLSAYYLGEIQQLAPWQLTALATAVTQRAWPNFALFAELTEFGNIAQVSHCLNMLWDYCSGAQSAKNFERLLENLDENTPAPEDFDMFGVQPALDFAVGLHCAINCAMKTSVDEVVSALIVSFSTIGKLIKYTEAPELKGTELVQYIAGHELYQVHQQFVTELVVMVSRQQKQAREFIRELQRFSANEGVSQLGISLH